MRISFNQPRSFCLVGQRPSQEDARFPDQDLPQEPWKVFVVCDGVGGEAHGQEASRVAADSLGNIAPGFNPDNLGPLIAHTLTALNEKAMELPEHKVIATTFTLLVPCEDGVLAAHMGDSRIYQVRPGVGIIFQSQDHSVVNAMVHSGNLSPQAAIGHPRSNVITACLKGEGPHFSPGISSVPNPSVTMIDDVEEGDYFFLCSDGVTHQIEDQELYSLLSNNKLSDSQKIDQLRELCLSSADNATAYLIPVSQVIKASSSINDISNAQPSSVPTRPLPVPKREGSRGGVFDLLTRLFCVILTALFSMSAINYDTPLPSPDRASKVAKQLKKASSKGDLSSTYTLARLYSQGLGVKKDSVMALKYFTFVAETDSTAVEPCLAAAAMCSTPEARLELISEAAKRGHLKSQQQAAMTCLEKGDTTAAMDFLKMSASQGDENAMNQLALMLDGTERYEEALEWLNQAIECHCYQQFPLLESYYKTGRKGFSPDPGKLLNLYSQCRNDTASAQWVDLPSVIYKQAMMVGRGEGCAKSIQRYEALMQLASDMGSPEASYRLALDYASDSLLYNEEKAYTALIYLVGGDEPKYANQVSPETIAQAYEMLAAAYRFGRGTNKDAEKKNYYLKLADKQRRQSKSKN